jgi:hypothetical protein
MNKQKGSLLILAALFVGIPIGGYLFPKSWPRSLSALDQCRNCLTQQDFLGLLASAGIQNFPGPMPLKVCETELRIFADSHMQLDWPGRISGRLRLSPELPPWRHMCIGHNRSLQIRHWGQS